MKNKIVKTYETFIGNLSKNDKYSDLENLSKPADGIGGEVDAATKNDILNVDNFNKWLRTEYSGYGGRGGAAGIIGRKDKLSTSMIEDYFTYQGVQCSNAEIRDFQDKIRLAW
ncbi:hypothetical protein M0Q97_10315 [Candidatus Dojkabacteria bacterium]|jgi:hypothetical protein|nr:hypothetical protein [Candidatus Dojkabacteria bacterium]